MARRISPRRSPSLFPSFYLNIHGTHWYMYLLKALMLNHHLQADPLVRSIYYCKNNCSSSSQIKSLYLFLFTSGHFSVKSGRVCWMSDSQVYCQSTPVDHSSRNLLSRRPVLSSASSQCGNDLSFFYRHEGTMRSQGHQLTFSTRSHTTAVVVYRWLLATPLQIAEKAHLLVCPIGLSFSLSVDKRTCQYARKMLHSHKRLMLILTCSK